MRETRDFMKQLLNFLQVITTGVWKVHAWPLFSYRVYDSGKMRIALFRKPATQGTCVLHHSENLPCKMNLLHGNLALYIRF